MARQGGKRPGLQSAVTSEPGCRVHGHGTGGGEAWETQKGLEYREPELEEPAGLRPIVDRRNDTYGRLEAGEGCGYAPCVADRGGGVGEKELGRATPVAPARLTQKSVLANIDMCDDVFCVLECGFSSRAA